MSQTPAREPLDPDYLPTLLLYYEEERMGESYFTLTPTLPEKA